MFDPITIIFTGSMIISTGCISGFGYFSYLDSITNNTNKLTT